MASRLAARVVRAEERLAPTGGSHLLRLIYEAMGATYVPTPGDEALTLELLVRQSYERERQAATADEEEEVGEAAE